jgi:bacillithiol biosynthesis cysteine-adding enzyme BshC
MDCTATHLPYSATGYFSKIVTDYLERSPSLRSFYEHEVNLDGVRSAIRARQQFHTDRELLVTELAKQYSAVSASDKVKKNLELLRNENVFTICTAHQPNIFTGHLYFIYKILHAIKLADSLSAELKSYQFIPVFYMGSEDADLEELGNIWLNGEKLTWQTEQSGAVGRMGTAGLDKIIDRIEGELSVLPNGKKLVDLLKGCYLENSNIQQATFQLINELFGQYGLIVLIADNQQLKRKMLPVFRQDILEQKPSALVEESIDQMQQVGIKVQANPRDINLFYLQDNLRERLKQNGNGLHVHNTNLAFSTEEILKELENHPENFSPNVILRGLYQETILPDIAFIGGGGELAYWLELKSLFEHYEVPFPMLVLRNSFLLVEEKLQEKFERLGLHISDLFKSEWELLDAFVKKQSGNQLSLAKEKEELREFYKKQQELVENVDKGLKQHIAALEAKALKKLDALEKKMIRAEKRKFAEEQHLIHELKQTLFPNGDLQERVENFMPYYARWGDKFINTIYQQSLTLEQQFIVLLCKA